MDGLWDIWRWTDGPVDRPRTDRDDYIGPSDKLGSNISKKEIDENYFHEKQKQDSIKIYVRKKF